MLGGGMRQAGIVAAAGLVALRKMIPRLLEDHHRATAFATGLRTLAPGELEVLEPQTNMVLFRALNLSTPRFIAMLRKRQLLVGQMGPWIRAVTHLGNTDEDIKRALQCVEQALADVPNRTACPAFS